MDTMLAGVEFATSYLDDILLRSKNKEQFKKHIKAVFQIDKYGFKLDSEKCEFFMKQIKYLGQIIDENSRKPDPERTEVIKNMPPPNNVTNLRAFLHLVNYYSIYIPKMYDLRAPLNDLLEKGAKWIWSKECEDAL